MYYQNKVVIYSPSDLTRYMESPFASWMDRLALDNENIKELKDPEDALMSRLAQKGYEHEDLQESAFLNSGKQVVKITSKGQQALDDTVQAMNDGVDVIVQAYLQLDQFSGYADFLVKVPGASNLGDYHYEVWDTKLAGSVKPKFLMQLCCYAEMLQVIQGVLPKTITVALGNNEKETFETVLYFAYYQQLKKQFLAAQSNFDPNSRPDPFDSYSYLNWSQYASRLLEESDHVSLVANIRRSQVQKLEKAGITTLSQLATSSLTEVPKLSREVFTRLKKQAKLQIDSHGLEQPKYEVLTENFEQDSNAELTGLSSLPPHSPYDVFFDIEGFPLVEGGLEYLWGATYYESDGARTFRDFWAHNEDEEKKAFEGFIKWVYKRWRKDPSMHIYHYASYEVSACRRLMGRYGVCEQEVDDLLRNQVFVDLYKVVKNGLIIGEPKYSIKNVEHLYRPKRDTEVGTGGDSVVVYDQWRELNALGEEGYTWRDSKILKDIRDYNIDDCDSTEELTQWLRKRQKEHGIIYTGSHELKEQNVPEEVIEKNQLSERLLAKAQHDSSLSSEEKRLTENMAWFLEFHRRNNKPVYWRLFDRLGLTDEELEEDMDCLAACVRTGAEPVKPTPRARNLAYEYRFDPDQEFKGVSSRYYVLGLTAESGKPVTVAYVESLSDLENGLISLQSSKELPNHITLIPDQIVSAKVIEDALNDMVKEFDAGGFRSNYSAIHDYLLRRTPRIRGRQDGPIVTADDLNGRLSQTIDAIKRLDNSYLPIQGPPGAGKTHTGKKAIAELLKSGKRVGIASNSHKAITNLLMATLEECDEQGITASFVSTDKSDAENMAEQGVVIVDNNSIINHIHKPCLVGTTAWGFAREELINQFDYLFIDEAGQVSVANLIAMSRSSKNLVILGDQMQLGQPTEGVHPGESGLSVLDYLMHGKATIDASMGVFLGTTFRMHSQINSFISPYIYEGKLTSDAENDKRVISKPSHYTGIINKEAGIQFIPVVHEGNTQGSDEEVDVIEQVVKDLVGRDYFDGKGFRQLSIEDILFVAPYNMQVRKLKMKLGEEAKVGSIDKFQGQEAPVVILSMCTSDPNESPRGLEFIFDKNRLNVAISRAQSLVVVVGSPLLAIASVGRVDQLERVNLFSALSQYSV